MEQLKTPLTNMQQELLKLFSRDLEESEIREIKQLIVGYLSEKLDGLTDNVWDQNNLSDQDMEKLLETHLRTPYKE